MPIVNCDKLDCIHNEDGWCEEDMINIEVLECVSFEEEGEQDG